LRRQFWGAAVTAWTNAEKEARAARSKTREELAALDSLGRLIAQRQTILECLARYCRERPQADVAAALLALIVFMSDNDQGCCTLSIQRLAEVFARKPRRITEALRRLEAAGIVHREERLGTSTRYWPVVHPMFGDTQGALIWFVQAYSPRPALALTDPSSPRLRTPDGAVTPPLTDPSGNTTKRDTTGGERVLSEEECAWVGARLVLRGAEHAYWLKRLGSEENLADALDEAAGAIQPNGRKLLVVEVRRQLARIARIRRDYANRYRERDAPGASGRKSKVEQVAEQTAAFYREAGVS
jgi:hypothetical protein